MPSIDTIVTRAINALAGRFALLDMIMIFVSASLVPIMRGAVALRWWFPVKNMRTHTIVIGAGIAFNIGLLIK